MSDEQTLTGLVEGIEGPKEGIDKNDKPFKRYVFTINGKKFSAYNPTYNLPINGDEVEIKYTVSGVYSNLTYLRILGPNDIVQTVEAPVVQPAAQEPVNSIPAPPIEPTTTPTAAPAQPIPEVNNYTKMDETSASIVAQCLIKANAVMVANGAIEPGKFKSNLAELVESYKTTKQRLLE